MVLAEPKVKKKIPLICFWDRVQTKICVTDRYFVKISFSSYLTAKYVFPSKTGIRKVLWNQ